MKDIITVIVKNPGEPAEPREIPNTLEELQEIVGGYIEVVTPCTDAAIICNEEGKLRGMPFNGRLLGEDFVGPLIFVGIDGEDFDDFPGGMDVWDRTFGKGAWAI